MSLRIRIEHGQDAGQTYRLPTDGVYVLGRHPSASLRVLDMKVSKAHCEIHLANGDGGSQAMLRELGSTHGTLVNGQPVTAERPKPLKPGDEIRLGLSILRILSDGDADRDLAPADDRNVDGDDMAKATGMSTRDHAKSAKELPPDELVGRELGGYKILKKIGQGGMGAVYIAQQVSLHRQVALKVLSEKFVKDSTFVDQFLNEARAAGQLNHPNVVQVYDVGEASGHYYFSMEFVNGGSLEEKLKAGDEYSWQDALNWFLDATNALIFANKRGILHRDVKPDNLMISEDDSAKLCDLGLAKRPENSDLMDQGIIGTPHFISPEAIRRKTNIDVRTDLYSLGCTFFRLLAGQNPYPGKTVKEILLGHLNKPVPRVTDHKKDIPRDLDDIVQKLMQKEPDERYQTPDELLADLDKVRLRHGLEAHGIRPHSRKPLLILGAAAAVLLGVLLFVFLGQEPEVVVDAQPAHVIFNNYKAEVSSITTGLSSATTNLKSDYTDLFAEFAGGNLGGTWDDPKWTTLATKLDDLVEKAETQIATWRNERTEKVKALEKAVADVRAGKMDGPEDKQALRQVETLDDTVTEAYESAIAELEDVATNARKMADEEIRATVSRRRANQEKERQKREETITGATADAKAIAEAANKAAEAGDVVALVIALDPAAIEARIAHWSDAQVDGASVVQPEEDIQPLFVAELGDELGQQKWVQPALEAMRTRHADALTKATEAARPNTHEGFDQAIGDLEAYLETLPENPDEKAGDVAQQLKDYRTTVSERIQALKTQKRQLGQADLRFDRQRLFVLMHELRRPDFLDHKGGYYAGWDFEEAVGAARRAEKELRTPEFKERAALHRRDAEALQGLIERAVSTFPDWEEDRFQYENEQGKTERGTIKGLTSKTVQFKNDTVLLRDLAPLQVVDVIFFYKGEPRFAFEAGDYRALALLAEMGGDGDRAAAWWKQYESQLDPSAEGMADARFKQGQLPAEMAIASRYADVQKIVKELRDFIAAHDPEVIGMEAFDKEIRAEIETEVSRLMAKIGEANTLVSVMLDTPEWAATAWGAGLRKTPPAE